MDKIDNIHWGESPQSRTGTPTLTFSREVIPPFLPECTDAFDCALCIKGKRIDMPPVEYDNWGSVHTPFCTCKQGKTAFRQWTREKPQQDNAEKVRERLRQNAMKSGGLSPRFCTKTIQDLKSNEPLMNTISTYVNGWPKYSADGIGFFFAGNVGAGKTHTAAAICNALIDKYFVRVHFVKCAEAIEKIRNHQINQNSDTPFRQMQEAQLLVIDDMGMDKPTDYLRDILFRIIDYRYEHKKPVIITSNQSLDALQDHYTPQIVSRLTEMCISLKFNGSDLRDNRRPKL